MYISKLPQSLLFILVLAVGPLAKGQNLPFHILQSVRLGIHKDLQSMQSDLEKKNCNLVNWDYKVGVKPVLPQFELMKDTSEFLIGYITTFELGFYNSAAITGDSLYNIVLDKIVMIDSISYNVELCPFEVGPELIMQLEDRYTNTEYFAVRIAMIPILDTDGVSKMFSIQSYIDKKTHKVVKDLVVYNCDDINYQGKPTELASYWGSEKVAFLLRRISRQ